MNANKKNPIKKASKNSRIESIIHNINSLIKFHSLSLRQLSKAINKAQPYLLRLLRGEHPNPGIDSLEALSDFFGISLLQLIGKEPIDFNNLPKLNYLNLNTQQNENTKQTTPDKPTKLSSKEENKITSYDDDTKTTPELDPNSFGS